MTRPAFALATALAAAFWVAGPAAAHRTNLATAEVTVAGAEVDYRLIVSPHDLAVALGIETDLVTPVPQAAFEARRAALARYVTTRLTLTNDGAACPPGPVGVDYDRLPRDLVIRVSFRCAEDVRELAINYRMFFDIDAGHRSIGSLKMPGGTEEFLFDRAMTSLEMTVDQPRSQLPWLERFGRILTLGVSHILTGYDHLLFLFALLIAASGLWQTVTIVTAFTVSHSLTLALAWFGVIALPGRLVESLIAVSIAYVAIENILARGFRRRWLVAGGFGLVHGLGFYAVLSELDLARGHVVTTLLGFNLGVEAGQLAVVALTYFPLRWWARQSWFRPTARAGSGVILAIATWWIFQRLFLYS